MNWITILGIVIIGFGTLLTYYGSSLSSSKDKKEITDKIDDFNKHIEEIKTEDIPASKKEEKIKIIEGEFNSWAEQFTKNKEEQRIVYDKNEIGLRERKDQLNKYWRDSYVNFFQSLNQMVNAMNKVNGKNAIVVKENSKFPNNIYEAIPETFHVVVQFKEGVYWHIWLRVKDPLEFDRIPSIEISVSKKTEFLDVGWGDLSLISIPNTKKINVETMNSFQKTGYKNEYDLDSEGKQLTELMKKAFEYQILQIEK